MEYFLINGASRADLRKILQGVQYKTHSSCYEVDGRFYLVIAGTTATLSQGLVPITTKQLIRLLDFSVLSKKAIKSSNTALALAQEFLQCWALSEINQSIEFINFEQQAHNLVNSCQIIYNGITISRSYLPLGEIMLIINCTPDSFSADGSLNLADNLLRIKQALAAGISIIDIGAESTRPNASVLSVQEEIARLSPLLAELAVLKRQVQFKLSLDSYKTQTIEHFLEQIDIINDVSGSLDAACLSKCAAQGKTYLFMHSLKVPADPSLTIAMTTNPIQEIMTWGELKLKQLYQLGFSTQQLILDVGIGFNKSSAQSWYLLKNFARLKALGIPLLIGHSRKRFLNKICAQEFSLRDLESAAVANILLQRGVDYVRLHGYQDLYSLLRVSNQFLV
jgi:dihydropteroate synthase